MSGEGAPDLRILVEQVKGKLAVVEALQLQQNALLEMSLKNQEAMNKEFKARLLKQENCPCQVRRDPGFECPLNNLRLLMAKYVGMAVGAGFLLQVLLQLALHYLWPR